MGGNAAAQALNAGNHSVKHPFRFGRIDHSKGMVILHAPAVDHIRLKILQFFPESRFQLRLVNMGRGQRDGGIAAKRIQLARHPGSPVEYPQSESLSTQITEHMIHPVDVTLGFSTDGRPDHTRCTVAQPKQLHILPPP